MKPAEKCLFKWRLNLGSVSLLSNHLTWLSLHEPTVWSRKKSVPTSLCHSSLYFFHFITAIGGAVGLGLVSQK